jgi:hypothetical protein
LAAFFDKKTTTLETQAGHNKRRTPDVIRKRNLRGLLNLFGLLCQQSPQL